MSDLIEKAAVAVNDALGVSWAYSDYGGSGPGEWSAMSSDLRERCRDAVRAVLAEMREPTEDMVRAAQGPSRMINADHFATVWRVMIDAALAPMVCSQGQQKGPAE